MSNTKIHRPQGGDELVVENGGKVIVKTGGQIVPESEIQAGAIADVAGGTNWTAADKAKINAMLAALRAVGILAS